MKIIIIIFILFFSNLYSEESDSSKFEYPKTKYIGITVGVGVPEMLHIGITARILKGLYLNYKLGGLLKNTSDFIYFFEIGDISHTGEIVKYFYTGNNSEYFESGTWNISFTYTLMKDVLYLFRSEDLSDANYYSLRIGNDFYLSNNFAIQVGIGIGTGNVLKENNSDFILPSGKINLLIWFD